MHKMFIFKRIYQRLFEIRLNFIEFLFYESKYSGFEHTRWSTFNRSSNGPNWPEKSVSLNLHATTSVMVNSVGDKFRLRLHVLCVQNVCWNWWRYDTVLV